MMQRIDSKCDYCEQLADWRIVDRMGNIRAAACKHHKSERKHAFYGTVPAPDTSKEHKFKASKEHSLYCHHCGASETDHRL